MELSKSQPLNLDPGAAGLTNHKSSDLVEQSSSLISTLKLPCGFRSIEWTPDANWLAVGRTDGIVGLYNIDNKTEMSTLQGHTDEVYCVSWSSDGRLASCSGDCNVRLWNAKDKCVEHVLHGHTGTVNGVSWSPDGKRVVSCSADRTVRLWNASNGEQIRILTDYTHSIMCVAWSPEGNRIASGSRDRIVRLREANGGWVLRDLQAHEGDVLSIAWSPDRACLASTSADGIVRLWNASNGSELSILRGHASSVTSVAWSPDGKNLASGSNDRRVIIWNANLGSQLRILRGCTSGIRGVAWSHDGLLLAIASYHEIFIWRTDVWEPIALCNNEEGFKTLLRPMKDIHLADVKPCNDESMPGKFSQQGQEAGEQKPSLICPSCHAVLPGNLVSNRLKRGFDFIRCRTCHSLVSFITGQILPDELNDVGHEIEQYKEKREPQNVQSMVHQKFAQQTFDVYFCYNEQDKSTVEAIAEKLKRQGIIPCVGKQDLQPGLPVGLFLEHQIGYIKAAAVFIGQQGFTSQQLMEMYAFLQEFHERGCPVIPIRLPGVSVKLELPPFLRLMQEIDFNVQEPDPVQQLIWGITENRNYP